MGAEIPFGEEGDEGFAGGRGCTVWGVSERQDEGRRETYEGDAGGEAEMRAASVTFRVWTYMSLNSSAYLSIKRRQRHIVVDQPSMLTKGLVRHPHPSPNPPIPNPLRLPRPSPHQQRGSKPRPGPIPPYRRSSYAQRRASVGQSPHAVEGAMIPRTGWQREGGSRVRRPNSRGKVR